jgi:hypothetical protein
MSDAIFQRSVDVSTQPASRPLPIGYGLVLAAMLSLGLWAALVLLALKLFA